MSEEIIDTVVDIIISEIEFWAQTVKTERVFCLPIDECFAEDFTLSAEIHFCVERTYIFGDDLEPPEEEITVSHFALTVEKFTLVDEYGLEVYLSVNEYNELINSVINKVNNKLKKPI